MGNQIFFRGSYSGDQLTLLERVLEASSVFVDVGANQGEFTIAAAIIAGQGEIIAIEPVDEFRGRLLENIRLNGLSNVRVAPIALGDEEGSLPIFDSETLFPDGTMHDGLTTLFASPSRSRCRGIVPVRTLDAVLEELAVARVDVIKLDIEGAEWMALRGAAKTLSKYRPMLILEVGRETCRAAGYEPEDFVAWLLGQNYQLERVVDGGRTEPIAVGSLTGFQNIVAYPR